MNPYVKFTFNILSFLIFMFCVKILSNITKQPVHEVLIVIIAFWYFVDNLGRK
jgi:hypothetical protein